MIEKYKYPEIYINLKDKMALYEKIKEVDTGDFGSYVVKKIQKELKGLPLEDQNKILSKRLLDIGINPYVIYINGR